MPSTRSASRHKAGKATSALLDGGRLACVAEFLALKDFCSLAVTSRGRLAAVEDPSTLTALATAYPVLRAKAVRARVAASGRELVELARRHEPILKRERLDDAGFECIVDVTLPNGTRISECGRLECGSMDYDVYGDAGGMVITLQKFAIFPFTGKNRDVVAMNVPFDYDAIANDPNFDRESDEAHQLSAVIEEWTRLGGTATVTLVRERDGKVLTLYDGTIELARHETWPENWEKFHSVSLSHQIPLHPERSGTITPSSYNHHFLCGAELTVGPCTSNGITFDYKAEGLYLTLESHKAPNRHGLYDRFHPAEIKTMGGLYDLLDYCGDWR
jgi:hypothetical protein